MTTNSTRLVVSKKDRFVKLMLCIVMGFTGGVFNSHCSSLGMIGLRQKNGLVLLGGRGLI